jgi:hypothetical protein
VRSIKFRGYNHNAGWVYGDLYKDQYEISGDSCTDVILIRDETFQDYIVKEETVGQYTGYKDIDGVDIYEGDKLGIHENYVEYCNGTWSINGDRALRHFADFIKITGNIHNLK